MSTTTRPVFQAIVDEAVAAAGASTGWLLGADGDELVVLAASPETSDGAERVGRRVPVSGARGYALSSGQPSALMPGPSDESNRDVGGHDGIPPSLLVAPGGDGTVVLEVAAKATGGGFTFEDIEVVAAFANVAASAREEGDTVGAPVASPTQLAAELSALAALDARRYRAVASVVEALLGQGR